MSTTLTALWILIALLIVTGGFYGKIELSQVDLFGWTLLILTFLHFKKSGKALSPFLEKKTANLATKLKRLDPLRVLAVLIAANTLLYTWAQVWRYQSFHSNAFDLSFADQAIWSTAHLKESALAFGSSISRNGTLLSEHFSPIFALIAPLYRLWDSVYWLLFLLPVFVSSGALFVYLIGRQEKIQPLPSLLLSTLYLMHPSVRSAMLFDFKEDAFFIPLLFGVVYAFRANRWRLFWCLAAFTLLVKENAPFALFGVGIWLVAQKNKRHGLALCLVSLAAFAMINLWVMPSFFQGESQSVLAGRLSPLGGTTSEVFKNLVSNPIDSLIKILKAKIDQGSFKYVYKILFPVIFFVSFRSLKTAAPFLVTLFLVALNLLFTPQRIGYHYELILTPFLMATLAIGFRLRSNQWGTVPAAVLALISLFCVYGRSPLVSIRQYAPTDGHHCLQQAVNLIPQEASVLTQSSIHPHLAHRKTANLFQTADQAFEDFIAVSTWERLSLYASEAMPEQLKRIDPLKYQRVVSSRMVSIWCRVDACGRYEKASRDLKTLHCLKEGHQ
ncbi:MAG: DUF2079 domain-containing protein [Bdellovibrionota bacterium]